ncbi:hypothetical protein RDn1_192 [Candidatus Termititenax dinenymphae]|uniref:Uncharacterized protein n=1 Tax=Candidatus Termititenax dinenymphae TaxID=2218523 RepID=A0A388TJQ4_9BACT|nr:hypothetical protein RDn1_192 [Candidatus Termititenax dinenymphae]
MASIEESLIAKINLNELQPEEKPAALVDYFNNILTGKVKTGPVELKALLNLMIENKSVDNKNVILTYVNTHQISMDHFFSDNMQRFDRFEFKSYFLRIKGIEPGREFSVPINARRNFENVKPLDTKMYKDMLEGDQSTLSLKKAKLQTVDADTLEAMRTQEIKKITETVNGLHQTVAAKIQSGATSQEQVLEKLQFVEELFIPALQLRYNEPSLQKLAEVLLNGAEQNTVSEIFASLKMPHKQRELFCAALAKKL